MNQFEGFPLMTSYSLFGIHPEIELAPLLKATPRQLQVFDSRLNHEQLNVLLNTASHLRMGNMEFAGTTGDLTPTMGTWWTIEKTKPGEVGKILGSIKSFKGVGGVTIYETDCDLEDWKQIVRASQECPVRLHYVTVPEDLFDQWKTDAQRVAQTIECSIFEKASKHGNSFGI